MREHRKIDDSVTMRLNRNQALFRDREREGVQMDRGTIKAQDEACMYFWSQLVGEYFYLSFIFPLLCLFAGEFREC